MRQTVAARTPLPQPAVMGQILDPIKVVLARFSRIAASGHLPPTTMEMRLVELSKQAMLLVKMLCQNKHQEDLVLQHLDSALQ